MHVKKNTPDYAQFDYYKGRTPTGTVPVTHILGIASDHVIPVQMEVCNVPEFAGPARPAGERQHQQQRPLLQHCA
jgi:hypothetical protein